MFSSWFCHLQPFKNVVCAICTVVEKVDFQRFACWKCGKLFAFFRPVLKKCGLNGQKKPKFFTFSTVRMLKRFFWKKWFFDRQTTWQGKTRRTHTDETPSFWGASNKKMGILNCAFKVRNSPERIIWQQNSGISRNFMRHFLRASLFLLIFLQRGAVLASKWRRFLKNLPFCMMKFMRQRWILMPSLLWRSCAACALFLRSFFFATGKSFRVLLVRCRSASLSNLQALSKALGKKRKHSIKKSGRAFGNTPVFAYNHII